MAQAGTGLQHDDAQAPGAPHAGSQQAVGSVHDVASVQPLGAPHAGSQQLAGWQQEPPPSILSSNVAPLLWAQRPTVSTKVPKSRFHFIDQHLLTGWN
jgi:hypothetical protein